MDAVTGVVLAGGKSTRFGSDKASALLRGRPLLQWVLDAVGAASAAVVVVKARGQVLPAFDCAVPCLVVEDIYEAQGPLAGLVAGFERVQTPLAFATSCDSPLLAPALVSRLAALADEADVVCPEVGGRRQPLAAIHRPAACLPAFRRSVDGGRLRIVDGFDGLRVRMVAERELVDVDPRLLSFENANTPERLAEIDRLLG